MKNFHLLLPLQLIYFLGEVVFELSNRIQNISRVSRNSTAAKLFGKAQVDLKLSLGQLIRNAIFEEAEIEFQPVAFFNTRIGLRNALQVRKYSVVGFCNFRYHKKNSEIQ